MRAAATPTAPSAEVTGASPEAGRRAHSDAVPHATPDPFDNAVGPGAVDLARSVVVADHVTPGPGQIRRADLLVRGSEVVRRAADEELATVGRSSDTCPYVAMWLARFATYDAARLERAVVLFARPAATGMGAYLQAVEARVRQAVRTWITSGRVDLPAGVTALHPGAETTALQRYADPGAPALPPTTAVVAGLGPGGPLPAAARVPMERTLAADLSTVRIHTDAAAANAARAQRARALTVGEHVVFGAGRFDAGSLPGRALLAHELAHVVQQRGGGGAGDERADEREADAAAVATLQGEPSRLRSRGGLALRHCGTEGTEYDPAEHDESHARLARRSPEQMIADHTSPVGDLDEDGLAKVLADMLWYSPGDHADYVRRVFQALESHNTDDVAGLMLAKLSDRDLAEIAAKPTGRALLEYLVPELEEGWTFPGSDLHAATRAARAAVARRSSAAAAKAEIEAMEQALTGIPVPTEAAPRGTATVAERRAIVTSELADFDLTWASSPEVRAALAQVRRGLAAAANASSGQAARLPYAQASLPVVRFLLANVDAQLQRVRQNPSGTSAAASDLLVFVRGQTIQALALTFEQGGPQQLARARVAFDRLGLAMTRLELAVLEDRPTQFAEMRPKLERMRSFARWASGELAQVRALRPATAAEAEAVAQRFQGLVAASRLLAHWEVLIQTGEALASGFSFTEAFYGHDVDVDSIHGDLARLAALAEGGNRAAFTAGVDAFAARSEIQAYYQDVPRILRSSGIAVGIIITVVAAAATMGAGAYLGIGAGAAATTSTATAVGTFVAATAVDALVFTSVHQLLATATGQGGGGSFFEELAWNFGLFGVLRLGGGLLGRAMLARGLSRTAVGVAQLAGSAGLLEVYGVFRFWLAEGRLPTADELALMTGEMLVVLALLVALHVAVEPHTPLGRFEREFGAEFRAIEAERAQLQADVNTALQEGRMADAEAGFRQRGEALEQRTKTWAEQAAASSRVPAVRNQLRGMRGIQQRAGAYLAESLGLPARAEVQSAGPSTDFTIAHGTVPEVRQSMSARGAEVNLLRVEGRADGRGGPLRPRRGPALRRARPDRPRADPTAPRGRARPGVGRGRGAHSRPHARSGGRGRADHTVPEPVRRPGTVLERPGRSRLPGVQRPRRCGGPRHVDAAHRRRSPGPAARVARPGVPPCPVATSRRPASARCGGEPGHDQDVPVPGARGAAGPRAADPGAG